MKYMFLHLAPYPQSWGLTRAGCRCRSISVPSLEVSSKKERGQNVPLIMRINVPLSNVILSTIYIHCWQTAVGWPGIVLLLYHLEILFCKWLWSPSSWLRVTPMLPDLSWKQSARLGSLLTHLTTFPRSKLSFWATSPRNCIWCFQSMQLRKTDANGVDISQLSWAPRSIDVIWLLYQYQRVLKKSWGISAIQYHTLVWLSVCNSDFFK